MMTKKHFKALAKAIVESNASYSPDGIYLEKRVFIDKLIEILIDQNPRFDIERFLEDCYE